MPVSRLAVLFLIFFAPAAHANWETYVAPEDSPYSPGRASIQYKPLDGDIPTFRDAIEQLREAGHLDRLETIMILGATLEPNFQQELIAALETHAPREFADAIASAESVNGPGMEALRACLLYTSPSPRDGLLSRMPSSA